MSVSYTHLDVYKRQGIEFVNGILRCSLALIIVLSNTNNYNRHCHVTVYQKYWKFGQFATEPTTKEAERLNSIRPLNQPKPCLIQVQLMVCYFSLIELFVVKEGESSP